MTYSDGQQPVDFELMKTERGPAFRCQKQNSIANFSQTTSPTSETKQQALHTKNGNRLLLEDLRQTHSSEAQPLAQIGGNIM